MTTSPDTGEASNAAPHVDLEGRVALVTGARRGIGRGIARRLAAHGAAIVIGCMSRDEPFVDETLTLFTKAGYPHSLVEADLADAGSRADLYRRASEAFGPPDILINNAAAGFADPPSTISLEHRRLLFEVNFQAPIDLTQQALPRLVEQGWGRIVNILSDSMYQQPLPYGSPPQILHGLTLYGASKVALARYTEGLAGELFGTGVHVNGLYPHKVALTEAQSERALIGLRNHPEYAENLEILAEAAYQLVHGSINGLVTTSRGLLDLLQQPLRAFDGVTVIGDASTLPTLPMPGGATVPS